MFGHIEKRFRNNQINDFKSYKKHVIKHCNNFSPMVPSLVLHVVTPWVNFEESVLNALEKQ